MLAQESGSRLGESAESAQSSWMTRGAVAVIAILLAIGLLRAFVANINWDEFYYLSLVHLYLDGRLSVQLQTLHVHLFAWLPFVSENEVQQIQAARVALWVLSLVSSWLIFAIAKRFCSTEASLVCVAFYLGFSYVVDHGLSFRSDPLCAFLFLAALHLLLSAERSPCRLAISALCMAAALMVSIKSVFYLGTVGAILVGSFFLESDKGAIARSLLVYAAALTASLAAIYFAHSSVLVREALPDPGGFITAAGNKTLLSVPFLPRSHTILNALFQNGIVWLFIAAGSVVAGARMLKGPERKSGLELLSFAVPLFSLLFYRNAFPYFFVFLMPAVVVLGGVFADSLIAKARRSGSAVLTLVLAGSVLAVLGSAVADYVRRLPDQKVAQSEIIAVVHRMFPEPVPYVDRNSMISSYPKVGIFMSTWGVESYRAKGRPVMDRLIRAKQPRFLIANTCGLDISRPANGDGAACSYRLFDEDFEALRANFVPHWGAIYVAGKRFEPAALSRTRSFEILIPGVYTVEADAAVVIDGVTYRPGAQVELDQATHSIAAAAAPTGAVLRFGTDLYRPDHAPSSQPIYQNF